MAIKILMLTLILLIGVVLLLFGVQQSLAQGTPTPRVIGVLVYDEQTGQLFLRPLSDFLVPTQTPTATNNPTKTPTSTATAVITPPPTFTSVPTPTQEPELCIGLTIDNRRVRSTPAILSTNILGVEGPGAIIRFEAQYRDITYLWWRFTWDMVLDPDTGQERAVTGWMAVQTLSTGEWYIANRTAACTRLPFENPF